MIMKLGGKDNQLPVMIEFIDVLVHMFETQLPGSILLDISQFEINSFVKDNKELLEKQKDSAWPMYYEKVRICLNIYYMKITTIM